MQLGARQNATVLKNGAYLHECEKMSQVLGKYTFIFCHHRQGSGINIHQRQGSLQRIGLLNFLHKTPLSAASCDKGQLFQCHHRVQPFCHHHPHPPGHRYYILGGQQFTIILALFILTLFLLHLLLILLFVVTCF